MRHESEQVTVHRYVSEVEPDVVATDEYCGRVIQWADEHPVVWRILKGTKSKAFGRESSFYMGFERGQSPSALLHRAVRFKRELEGDDGAITRSSDFHRWKIEFTFAHYGDKGFKSGFFQQHDPAGYSRGCSYLDYTAATLPEVLRRFQAWCDSGYRFETARITVDKKVVHEGPVPTLPKRKIRGGRPKEKS